MDKVFENNPNLKVYYKTSDGTAFYTESDAKLHAKTLDDKNVSPVFKDAVAFDLLDQTKSEEEKEAETQAQKEAEEKANQEAEVLAQKEADDKAKQEAPEKAKKVTQPKQK